MPCKLRKCIDVSAEDSLPARAFFQLLHYYSKLFKSDLIVEEAIKNLADLRF
jgi:hypothetical protein